MSGPSFHPVAFSLQRLTVLANEIEHELARLLGLNLTDYRALSSLAGSGEVTVGELARSLGTSAATMTAIVDRLESRGFADRHRSTEDRRRVVVGANPEGLQRVVGLMTPLMRGVDDHVRSLPAGDQRVVQAFLEVTLRHLAGQLATLSTAEQR